MAQREVVQAAPGHVVGGQREVERPLLVDDLPAPVGGVHHDVPPRRVPRLRAQQLRLAARPPAARSARRATRAGRPRARRTAGRCPRPPPPRARRGRAGRRARRARGRAPGASRRARAPRPAPRRGRAGANGAGSCRTCRRAASRACGSRGGGRASSGARPSRARARAGRADAAAIRRERDDEERVGVVEREAGAGHLPLREALVEQQRPALGAAVGCRRVQPVVHVRVVGGGRVVDDRRGQLVVRDGRRTSASRRSPRRRAARPARAGRT